MSDINLWIILGAAFLGGLIPGPGMMAGYVRFRRWIEGAFAAFFRGAAIYLIASREQ